MTGFNDFAPFPKINGCFVVRNISNPPKTLFIFNYPIPFDMERDLLAIPGVAESDIRASCLKGEVRNRILNGSLIVTCSDVDLLQFNDAQKTFLQNAGIVNGLEVSSGNNGITAQEHETLRQLIHFIDSGGPGDGFASGAVKITSPSGSPFPTSTIWYLDNTLTTKLVEKLITYTINQVPATITWNMYDFDGVSIVHSVVDTFTYTNNIFESSRVRSIS